MLIVAAPVLARAQEGKLVLYTSQPNQDAQQTIDAFKAKYPKVDITFVRDGTPRIVAKLRAEMEAGAAQADILLIADAVTMEDLKKDGRLLPYPEADLSAYPPAMHDKDKAWFATKLITTGIIYNTKAPFQPQSWSDLLKDETKGQVVMPSPLASGAALVHAATLTSNLDEGWGYYVKLKTNGGSPPPATATCSSRWPAARSCSAWSWISWRSAKRRRARRLRSCFQKRACPRSVSRSRS